MPINAISLKRATNSCFNDFKIYFTSSLKHLKNNLRYLKALEHDEELFQKIRSQEKQSNETYKNFYNQITWTISKEKPVAIGLDFFLAILSSLKDIERICDINYNVAKIFKNSLKKYEPSFVHEIINLYDLAYESLKKLWAAFLESPQKISLTCFKNCTKISEDFHKAYLKTLYYSAHEYFLYTVDKIYKNKNDKASVSDAESLLINLTIVGKQIERLLDHGLNIVENFYLIYSENQENKLIDKE